MRNLKAIRVGLLGGIALACALASLARAANDPPSTDSQAESGEAVFTGICAGCHGTGLAGGRGPSLFNKALLTARGDAGIRSIILKGIPGTEMPAFEGAIDDAQITSIIRYLHSSAVRLQPSAPSGALSSAPAHGPAMYTAPNPNGQRIHSEKQDFRIEAVATGLNMPWGLAFLPDGRLLVTERTPAQLRVIDASGKLLPPVENMPVVHQGQDAGLLDVAAGADYAKDGWIYLAYSDESPEVPQVSPPSAGETGRQTKRPSMTVIVRGKIDANNQWSEQQDIFRQPYSAYTRGDLHYGSRILFDGKGHVFFSIGDRGDAKIAQDLGSPIGKIHRVNLDGSVPADNPFAGRPGVVSSIWSYGHRNTQGLALDPATGLVWESEHGPNGGDEINIIDKGGNYGWPTVSMGQQPGVTQTAGSGFLPPVAWYSPTIAPSGIAFYHGRRYPGWNRSLFVGGLLGQQLRRLTVKGRRVVGQEILFAQLGRVRAMATGPDGLLYVLITEPTGPGTGVEIGAPVPGAVVRLVPIDWQQAAR